jgi:ribosomal protein S18 acetylase RimI-like enzyme
MSSIQIRLVVASDLPRLMGMDHSAFSEYVWQLELRRDVGQVVATFRDVRLPRPISLTYPHDPFALADEWKSMAVMVGYVALIENPLSTGWVTDLVVAPSWRRRGVGSALLDSAREWADQKGHRRIFLEMQSKNQAAIRLAQKQGYEFCGYNDHYYSSQDIALFFARAV